ncbi:MAG: hypothetical protein QXZ09_01775 [Candidatus Methanomethylicaceae archaeon]
MRSDDTVNQQKLRLAKLSVRELRQLVGESIAQHFAHVRAVSSTQFAARYYSPASEPLQVEKVLARLGMIGRYMPIGCGGESWMLAWAPGVCL